MKVTIVAILIGLMPSAIIAQRPGDGPPDPEKVDALRIAFLTDYLDLTSDESQKFWPVYNQMRDEMKVYMEKEENLLKNKKIDALTDAELSKIIQEHFDNEQAMLNIKKKYAEQFTKLLPMKKVVLLADAENAFKRKLLEHARDRQGGPGGRPDGDRSPYHILE
jgi:hypothetical protein